MTALLANDAIYWFANNRSHVRKPTSRAGAIDSGLCTVFRVKQLTVGGRLAQ